MGERFVGLGHLVRIILLLHRSTTTCSCIDKLTSQFFGHGFLVTLSRVLNQPTKGEGRSAVAPNLDGYLVYRTTDTATLHFQVRLDVIKRLLEQAKGVFAVRLSMMSNEPYTMASAVGRFLRGHQAVDELRQKSDRRKWDRVLSCASGLLYVVA